MEVSIQEFLYHFKSIFIILDPKNIYFDVLHHVLFRLIFLAFRSVRSASKRLYNISVLMFVILDPKILYFDILHHVLLTTIILYIQRLEVKMKVSI
jgi:hypothetical protein